MQINFNTDNNIKTGERHITYFSDYIKEALNRFSSHITRVDIHVSDENGPKEGKDDIKCVIEVKLEGLKPVVVTSHADEPETAIKTAPDRLKSAVGSVVERLKEH